MSTIAIKGLPISITRRKVEDLFYRFGKITGIGARDGIVFVTYKFYEDSQDAIVATNGYYLYGNILTVRQHVPKQKTVSFDQRPHFTLDARNAKCSVNIGEDGHGFIKIEF